MFPSLFFLVFSRAKERDITWGLTHVKTHVNICTEEVIVVSRGFSSTVFAGRLSRRKERLQGWAREFVFPPNRSRLGAAKEEELSCRSTKISSF